MKLHTLDIAIIVGYFVVVLLIGLWVSRKGAKDLDSYFLGGKTLPWYMLGISDASGMFDISGTMAKKIAALEAHASQVGGRGIGERMTAWAKTTGAAWNVPHAEAFRYLELA